VYADDRSAMPIDAVIFDCDGTLVDSVPLTTTVLVQYLAELGVVISEPDAVARFGGGRLAQCIADFERERGTRLPEDFAAQLRVRRADAVRQRLRPIDGAHELLDCLRIPAAVASNGPLAQTRLSLEVTDLLRFFPHHVFSAYDLDAWKPDPGLFLHAAQALGVPPSRCAVVEDDVVGVQAGIAAGMTVIALCADDRWAGENVRTVRRLADVRPHLTGRS
jgi:HAD superfamily hydrolase (TIGR01509 family)